MPIIPVYGHESLRRRFSDAVARGTLPAALLLTGPRGIGKQRLALWLAQVLLCESTETRPCGTCSQCKFARELRHPDLHWYFPRPRPKDADPSPEDVREDYGEAIAERVSRSGLYAPSDGSEGLFVATVRAIVRSATMSPALAGRKVFVIGDAERMVPQEGADAAANAFLKLLEEPPADTTIILTSSEPGALLPTIRSRVAALRVPPLVDADVKRFLCDAVVAERLRTNEVKEDTNSLVRTASGAPGRLFASDAWIEASARARRLIEAATSGDRAALARMAFAQGASKARGTFSDVLDALTVALRDRAKRAAETGDQLGALGAAKAVASVEWAKERAAGNASPQLLTSHLLRELGSLLR